MDQIHEELKQPLSNTSTDDDSDNYLADSEKVYDAAASEAESISSASQQLQPAVEASSQSDAEYETCDSGMSSERSSVEHNLATEDTVEAFGEGSLHSVNTRCRQSQSDSALHSHTRVERLVRMDKGFNRSKKTEAVKVNADDSGISSAGSSTTLNSQASSAGDHSSKVTPTKHSPNSVTAVRSMEDARQHSDGDSVEFSDAVSELEPLQGQKVKVVAWSKCPGEKSPPRVRHLSDSERTKPYKPTAGPGAHKGGFSYCVF